MPLKLAMISRVKSAGTPLPFNLYREKQGVITDLYHFSTSRDKLNHFYSQISHKPILTVFTAVILEMLRPTEQPISQSVFPSADE